MRPINGYIGEYSITEDGKVWSHKSEKFIKTGSTKTGYRQAHLYNGGVERVFYVHRLVAQAFLPQKSDEKTEINHIDGDNGNNHYTNLEWVTSSENKRHSYKMLGRVPAVPSGADSNLSKAYRITFPNGEISNIIGLTEFCRIHDLRVSHMCSVAAGKRAHHKGFKCEPVN